MRLWEIINTVTPEQKQKVIDLYKQQSESGDVNYREIARQTNITHSSVLEILKRAGLWQQKLYQITPEQKQKVIDLYKQQSESGDVNYTEIARQTNIDIASVRNILKRAGLWQQNKYPITPEQTQKVIDLYKQQSESGDINYQEIARQTNIDHPGTVLNIIKRAGLWQQKLYPTTPEQKQKVIDLYNQQSESGDVNYREIARQTNIVPASVLNILKRAGLWQQKMYPISITPEQTQKVIDLYKQQSESGDINYQEIARQTNIGEASVRNILKRAGLWQQKLYPITPEQVKAAAEMYKSGMSLTDIAHILHIGPDFVRNLKKLPNYDELRQDWLANRHLHKRPKIATTKVYKSGRIDPSGVRPDWKIGRGYK